ncbi:MAG: cytidylyltransferase domain-containing protein [Polyangiales bacterium]
MRTLAIIPARGGNEALPDGALTRVAERTLLGWAVLGARGATSVHRVVVSSDSPAVLAEARQLGVEPMPRPPEVAGDPSPCQAAVVHALDVLLRVEGWVPDAVVLLPADAPLRTSEDVDMALTPIRRDAADGVLSTVEPQRSPFRAVRFNTDGYLLGLADDRSPFLHPSRLPRALMLNGAIYAVRTTAFRETGRLLTHRTVPYEMPEARSLEVRTLEDARVAERVLRRRTGRVRRVAS